MTIRAEVFVACDAYLRGCAGRVGAVAADVRGAVALARRRADEEGWVREQGPDGRWLDTCPWCDAALLAGADLWAHPATRPAAPTRPVPRTIGEAAELARRRLALLEEARGLLPLP